MPVVGTKAAASSQGFGEFAQAGTTTTYIEDVFSTYLYTGNGSTQTITNGIDLAGKGGLTWIKQRSISQYHALIDTARGNNSLSSNVTAGQAALGTLFSGFTSSGFTLGPDNGSNFLNGTDITYASWTFRKQPKFFDVVTFTGSQSYGGTGQVVNHSLGSTPGCIIVKPLSDTSGSGFTLNNWIVYHRGLSSPTTQYLRLNTTNAVDGNSDKVRAVSDTSFTAGWEIGLNGIQYVAYVFAHNAGGFGLTGTDNVISCGGFTVSGGATTTVNLGYEPQWVLIKRVDTTGNWELFDSMRGFTVDFNKSAKLFPNLSDAESAPGGSARVAVTSTGFQYNPVDSADQMIYIAIRRGPMKTPTSGTSVFTPFYFAGDSSTSRQLSAGAPTDLFYGFRTIGDGAAFVDRLRGKDVTLLPAYTQADTTYNLYCRFDSNSGPIIGYDAAAGININSSAYNYRAGAFRRAPGFFDEVCYTGVGGQTLNHNLGVTPELIISKRRSGAYDWTVYSSARGTSNTLFLNLANAETAYTSVSAATSTTFTVQGVADASGETLVAYLFASCPNVSKVGSYTGTGGTQTINCGFTGGARFVMIKRTDSTGNWWVWDTARGMVSGTDQRFAFNSASGEVNANWVYTNASGFQIVTTDATVNASGGSYIFLAIA